MGKVAPYVFAYEVSPLRPCGKEVVLALKATPLRKVVGYIKSSGGWCGILIVDKVDRCDAVSRTRLYDYVAAQQVAMGKDKLVESVGFNR